jgi:hypothetical protein
VGLREPGGAPHEAGVVVDVDVVVEVGAVQGGEHAVEDPHAVGGGQRARGRGCLFGHVVEVGDVAGVRARAADLQRGGRVVGGLLLVGEGHDGRLGRRARVRVVVFVGSSLALLPQAASPVFAVQAVHWILPSLCRRRSRGRCTWCTRPCRCRRRRCSGRRRRGGGGGASGRPRSPRARRRRSAGPRGARWGGAWGGRRSGGCGAGPRGPRSRRARRAARGGRSGRRDRAHVDLVDRAGEGERAATTTAAAQVGRVLAAVGLDAAVGRRGLLPQVAVEAVVVVDRLGGADAGGRLRRCFWATRSPPHPSCAGAPSP